MKKVALLIGVGDYEGDLPPLPKAVRDAEAIERVLKHPEMGGFGEEDITLLRNPTRLEMEIAVFHLFSHCTKEDLVLLYFSGHGIKDERGNLFFATSETYKDKGVLVQPTAVAASALHNNMNSSSSQRQVIILDCCFSGAFAHGLTAKDAGDRIDLEAQLGGEGRAILTSSTSTQYSFEQADSDLSVYTRFLVEGIDTGAADLDGDGSISVDELHEYAGSQVHKAAPAMSPEFYPVKQGHKILLSKARIGDPRIVYRQKVERYANRGEILESLHRIGLEALREKLKLSVEDSNAIEQEVLKPYKERLKNLERYREALEGALEYEYPLSEASHTVLRDTRDLLNLRAQDVEEINNQYIAQAAEKAETANQRLLRYESEFYQSIQEEFPLNAQKIKHLNRLKQSLGFHQNDQRVVDIETRITSQRERLHLSSLKKYEQELLKFLDADGNCSDFARQELNSLRVKLRLTTSHIDLIESRTISERKRHYKDAVESYEKRFIDTVQEEFPLSHTTYDQLKEYKRSLTLISKDTEAIEERIITQRQEKYDSDLDHYRQEFQQAIQIEFPLPNSVREHFSHLKGLMNLQEEDVAKVETTLIAQEKRAYQDALSQYEQAFRKALGGYYQLDPSARERLTARWRKLGLQSTDVERLEASLISECQQSYEEVLGRYQQEFETALGGYYQLDPSARKRLTAQWQKLGLQSADVEKLESAITEKIRKAYGETLNQYAQEFTAALNNHYQLVPSVRQQLTARYRELALQAEDVEMLENRIIEENRQRYESALNQYAKEFKAALGNYHQLAPEARQQLTAKWQTLKLLANDVETLEINITGEVSQNYHRALSQYEQAFKSALGNYYQLEPSARQQLTAQWRELGLRLTDVEKLETSILEGNQQTYQESLRRYKEAFCLALETCYPLESPVRARLDARWQALGLQSADVEKIETELTARRIQTYQKSLSQYEQEFKNALGEYYQLEPSARQHLSTRWHELGLQIADVEQLESRIIANSQHDYQTALSQYEQEFKVALDGYYQLNSSDRERLSARGQDLQLQPTDIDRLESVLINQNQQSYQASLSQYEQEFRGALGSYYQLESSARARLTAKWRKLKLRSGDIEQLESVVIAESKQTYEKALNRYEEAFRAALGSYYQLPNASERERLTEQWRDLELQLVDVQQLEAKITSEHQQNYQLALTEYEQAFLKALDNTGKVDPSSQQALEIRCQKLGLRSADVDSLESRLISEKKEAYNKALDRYRREFEQVAQKKRPISRLSKLRLNRLRQSLGIQSSTAVTAIETEVIAKIEAKAAQNTSTARLHNKVQSHSIPSHSAQSHSAQSHSAQPHSQTVSISEHPDVTVANRPKNRKKVVLAAGAVSALAVVALAAQQVNIANRDKAIRQASKERVLQIQALFDEGKHQECIENAQTVSADDFSLKPSQQLLGECQVAHARDLAAAENYSGAIAAASQLSEEHVLYKETKALIDTWAGNILTYAENQYKKGNLQAALDAAAVIPVSSSLNQEAKDKAKEWNEQWKANEKVLAEAEDAIGEGNWQTAKAKANTLLSESKHWKDLANPIISEAQSNINAEAARATPARASSVTPASSPAPVYREPAPVYREPAPVYREPAPLYREPARPAPPPPSIPVPNNDGGIGCGGGSC